MEWNIEKSKKSDCKDIAEFITKAWNESYKGIVNDEFLAGLKDSEEKRYTNAMNNFDDETNMQFVIKDKDKIVAFLKLLKDKDEEKKEYIEMQALYVLKEYQRKDLGKKLMYKAFEETKKNGFNSIIAGCLEDNKSNEFYKKMGGEIIKKREFKLPNQTLYENVYYYKV